jgi:polyhydroxybutyrate depolymerase
MHIPQKRIVLFVGLVGISSAGVLGCGPGEGGDTGTAGTTSGSAGGAGTGSGRGGGAGTGSGAGTSGSAGSSGTAGTTGAAGSVAGGGNGGNGGSTAGASGTGGTTAGAGGGASGNSGRGGGGGSGGSGGSTAGSGGAVGNGGSGGRGGRGGASGGGGTNAGGRGGTTGSAGTGGTTGSGGTGGGGNVTCPSPALRSGDTTRMVMVGSTNRSFILHVPSTYNGTTAVPLLVDFHPLGGSGSSERSGSPYPAVTDPEGVVMAFPTGLSGPSGGAWDVGPCCVANVDDIGFAKALVADVQRVACIDPKRIYATGFSMGGGMSHYVACHAADVFAAVAPAAFDLLQENVGDCKPPRPITVVSFRGTSDTLVPYNGGASSVVAGMPVTFLGAKQTMDKWAMINQCTGSASAADANNCQTYSNCAGGVEVSLCTQQGGGHAAGNARVGWPVLKRHTLP